MKIFYKTVLFFFLTAILFQSCTKIEEPYYTVKSVYADTNMRSVVLEDYTGHSCTNCPPAARTAQNLQALYKCQMFVISVHAGSFARPDSINYEGILKEDLRSPPGNDWFAWQPFHIDHNPIGMVNRTAYKSNISFDYDEWAGAVGVSAGLPKTAIISVNNRFDAASKTLTTTIGTRFLMNLPGKINLCACILEDSIYGGQLNSKPGDSIPYIKHYLFMEVLRGSLNGSWGEQIGTDVTVNSAICKSYVFDFNNQPAWIPKHCSILAFIMDADTREIYHAAKMEVVK